MSAPRSATVLICSTRAATGVYPDHTGPVIQTWLRDRGYACSLDVIADGPEVGERLRQAIAASVDLVITSGGTGLSPTDVTPEQTAPLLERTVPGIAEELRRAGAAKVPTALLSRGLAGVAERTFIVNLPGSTGGVRDGLAVLDTILEHALDQIRGGDHDR